MTDTDQSSDGADDSVDESPNDGGAAVSANSENTAHDLPDGSGSNAAGDDDHQNDVASGG